MENVPNKKKLKKMPDTRVMILIGVVVFLIVLGSLSVFAAAYDKIYKGVSVCGVELSGCSKDEAYAILSDTFGNDIPDISVYADGKTVEIPFADAAEYDFIQTAEDAFMVGRKNIFSSFWTYITPFAEREVPLFVDVKEDALRSALSDLQAQVKDAYKETEYTPEGDFLVIQTGHAGQAIDTEKLRNEIIEGLKRHENVSIEAETKEKSFEIPSADVMYDAIYAEPKDAYFDAENNKIVDHTDGYNFDKAAATKLLSNAKPDSEYKLPLMVVHPKKTTQMLEKELFSDLLGTYTTHYNAGNVNRSHNVALAASKFNGYVMMPDAVFSYNGVVGDRTVARGYRTAAVYTANGVEDGIGGGICQVSSTLYNAVLYANLEIVSRTNHSYPVSYAPKGQDATVSMGAIDFLFKNNTKSPIMVKTSVGGGNCTVSIYGKKANDFTVAVESTILSTTPFRVDYEDDPELPIGEEKVVREGITGYSVRTVRHVTVNGTTTTEVMPSSVYVTLSQKVKKGTKEPEETDAPTSNTDEGSKQGTQPGNADVTDTPSTPGTEQNGNADEGLSVWIG